MTTVAHRLGRALRGCVLACALLGVVPPPEALAQEFATEFLLTSAPGKLHVASPFRDRVDNVDNTVFIRDTKEGLTMTIIRREIVRLDVKYGVTPDVDPIVMAGIEIFRRDLPASIPDLGLANFNPVHTESRMDVLWPKARWFVFQASKDVWRHRLDAGLADPPIVMSKLETLADRNFPHWFGHGDWAVYEASAGGTDDATYRARFEESQGPEDVVEERIHEVPSEVNEHPRGSPAADPQDATFDMTLYAKSIGTPDHPRTIYRIRVGDADDFFLTVGANMTWIDEETYAYQKTIQGFNLVFRNAWDQETLAHSVSVLRANGSGGLLARRAHPVLRTPSSLALGDFDGDDLPDAVVAAQDSCSLAFLRGNGNGRFSRGTLPLPVETGQSGASSPYDIAAADLDLDGDDDLVVVERDQDRVRIFLWDATAAAFMPGPHYAVGDEPVAVAIGNFNPSDPSDPQDPESDPDTLPDIAVANHAGMSISILKQLLPGTPGMLGSFSLGETVAAANRVSDIATTDLDGDGFLDFAVPLDPDPNDQVTPDQHLVEIFEGSGTLLSSPSFTKVYSLAPIDDEQIGLVEPRPSGVVLVNLDGSGRLDVAACNLDADKVTRWLNSSTSGTWSFSNATFHAVGDKPTGIASGDVDGDGNEDVVTANVGSNDGSLLLGTGTGSFASAVTLPTDSKPWKVATGRFLGNDEKLDMAFACYLSDTVALVEADPTGTSPYRRTTSVVTGSSPRGLVAFKHQSGSADPPARLVAANFLSDDLSVFVPFVLPATNLVDPQSFRGPLDAGVTTETIRPSSIAALDFNGDGHLDLVLSSHPQPGIYYGAGDGTGRFGTFGVKAPPGSEPHRTLAVAAGRFNDDAYEDFAALDADQRKLLVYLSEFDPEDPGADPFASGPSQAIALDGSCSAVGGARFLIAADRPGETDGIPDFLYVVCGIDGTVLEFENNGSGTFSFSACIHLGNEPRQLTVGDFNGDGKLDGAVSFFGNGTLGLLLTGSGDETFMQGSLSTFSVPGASGVAAGRFNNDSAIDLAVTSLRDGTVRLLLNSASSPGTFTMTSAVDCGAGPVVLRAADLDDDGYDDLVIANAFGSADELLSGRSIDYISTFDQIATSPDGLHLAVNAAPGGGTGQELVIIDFDSTPPIERSLTDASEKRELPSWDPTSTRVYYERGGGSEPDFYVIRVVE